ncbi:MAG: serine/threonine-protein kinase [Myxococcota bacterium]
MPPDLARLTTLAEPRYRLGPPLGEGAFASVHRAYDRRTRRWVALKHGPDADRLRHEAGCLGRIADPHVVGLEGHLDGPDYAALALELLEGPDALSFVRGAAPREAPESAGRPRRNLPMAFGSPLQEEGRSGYVPLDAEGARRLRSVLRGALRGLGAVHAAGLLHLDLHAGNLRVVEGRAVLLDLGLARPIGATMRGQLATAHALAPELAEGRAGPASDLYALGVLLFEALTGRAPFEGGGPAVLVHKLTVAAPRASELIEDVPADLDALTADLLARAPGARPSIDDALARLMR